mgnify:CR=1 FL=1
MYRLVYCYCWLVVINRFFEYVITLILIKTFFEEETTFDIATSIYHMLLNIETVITN